jgi:hypothetical protein
MQPMTSGPPPERRVSPDRGDLPLALYECSQDLERLLVKAAPEDDLRRSVSAYVVAARRIGAPPERALAAFKLMLRTVHALESRILVDRTELSSWLVHAAIEAYYDGDGDGKLPARDGNGKRPTGSP